MAGVGDYTICYKDPAEVNYLFDKLVTTKGHQLAASVMLFSKLQHVMWYGKPSDYSVPDEIKFFSELHTTWDDTRFIDGYPADYAVVARKKNSQWYLSVMANSTQTVKVPLSFLTSKCKATAYTDYNNSIKISDYSYNENGQSFTLNDTLSIDIGYMGGAVYVFSPETQIITVVEEIKNIVETQGFETKEIEIGAVFKTTEGRTLSFDVQSDNTEVVTVSMSGSTIQFKEVGIGNSYITVTANDGFGNRISDVFMFTVNNSINNAPIVINPILDFELAVNEVFVFTMPDTVFVDIDGDSLSYTATLGDDSRLPEWLNFDELTHTFTGTPIQSGIITIKVSARDEYGGLSSDIFNLHVSSTIRLESLTNGVIVYPNPNDGDFIIRISFPQITEINGEIYNTVGIMIYSTALFSEKRINLQNYPKGMYLLRLYADDWVLNRKLLIN